MCNSGAEETREELRKQVYDSMAGEENMEAVGLKLESKDVTSSSQVEGEAGSDEHGLTGSEEPSGSSENEEAKSSVQLGSDASAQDVGEESEGLSAREDQTEPEKLNDAVSVEMKDEESDPEAEEDEGQSKGSRSMDAEHRDDDDDEDEEDGEKAAQDDEEDEVGNLQLAWEMLEVAKVIFKRKESKDEQLMAAQAHLKLGEVSAESGNYPQALVDFQDCLALQLTHLPPHSRLLAETHYHIATTFCYMGHYSHAIQHYNSSIKVIETRLAMLQEIIDAAEGADGATEEKKEMEELNQLLPDIRERVVDAKESMRTASAASQAIQQTLGNASTSSTLPCENGGPSSSSAFAAPSQVPVKACDGASSSKAVSDISHLVRKKRKPEEESPVKDTDAKKLKQEVAVNGGGDSSASHSKEIQEEKSQEPATQSASVDSSA
uniref:Nuclear autoantigenic sperm protein (Histone-binding) n=1 Tax=Nothobranchius pienaari TaxID=704102 RepID=A0A1A8LVH0_9TELE